MNELGFTRGHCTRCGAPAVAYVLFVDGASSVACTDCMAVLVQILWNLEDEEREAG